MHQRQLFRGFVLAAFVCVACGGEDGPGEIVRDTIDGVPAIMNPERGLLGDTLPWQLDEVLHVSGEQEFDGARALLALDVGVLPDGGFAVLDAGNRRVLRFGSDGGFQAAFSGPGDEPGRLRNPFFLEVADSLIYVLDMGHNRVNVFAPEGEFVSHFQISLEGLVGTTPIFEAGSADEVYLFAEPVPFMPQARDTGRAVLFRVDRGGTIADTVFTFEPTSWTPIETARGVSYAKTRLAAEPRISAVPGRVAAAVLARYMVEVRSAAGEPLRRVARVYENRKVTVEIRDSILDRLSEGPGGLSRTALERIPFASVIPAVEGLVLDDGGRLWIDVHAPDEPARYDVFDAEGRFLGPLYLPQQARLEEVRGDKACGVLSEASGNAEIVCYRVASDTAPAVAIR